MWSAREKMGWIYEWSDEIKQATGMSLTDFKEAVEDESGQRMKVIGVTRDPLRSEGTK